MFIVIGCMLVGIAVGYTGRRVPAIRVTGRLVTYTIWSLLFILGTVIGSDELIVRNFSTLGAQAFLLALAGVTGSLLSAWLVYNLFFRSK